MGHLGRGDLEGLGEGEGAAVDGNRGSGAGEGEGRRDSRGEAGDNRAGDGNKQQREKEEQEEPEGMGRGTDNGRPKRKRVRGVRYGEQGSNEPRNVGEGVKVYGPHKVPGKGRMYVGTVEDMILHKDHTGHDTRAAIVQWEAQEKGDNERLPYPEADCGGVRGGGRWKYRYISFHSRRCRS